MFGSLPLGGARAGGRGLFGSPHPKLPDAQKQSSYLDTTAGKLSALGDLFLRASGRGGNPLHQHRLREEQQQRALQAQQQQALAAQQRGREDFLFEQNYRQENPTPTAFERNVDSFQNFTPEQRAAWRQMNPEPNVVVPIPGIGTYVGPNSGIGSAFGQPPQGPVGRLTPVEPTTQNTPAPELSANRSPTFTFLTREQYAANVRDMGQAEADAWMRRNNIRVSN